MGSRLRPKLTAFTALSVLTMALVAALVSPAGAAQPKCFDKKATIVGTKGDDDLTGTNGRDVIVSKGGEDTIDSRGGKDLVSAGDDFDVVFAGGGKDKVKGQGGFNVIFPGGGDDFVDGGKDGGFVTYEGSSTPINADLGTGVITALDEMKSREWPASGAVKQTTSLRVPTTSTIWRASGATTS